MLLNDIGNAPNTKLKKINQYLETNYGFKIAENVHDEDLALIVEHIEGEIVQLKIQGSDAKESPEISKRLMILEGIKALREDFNAVQYYHQPEFEKVVGNLSRYVIDSIKLGDEMEDALCQAMKEYRSSRYRFPDEVVEGKVRSNCDSEFPRRAPPFVAPEVAPQGIPNLNMVEAEIEDIAQEETEEDSDLEESEKWIQGAHVEKNKGGLHKALHVPQGEKIPKSKIAAATHSDNPHTRHMAQFAKNVSEGVWSANVSPVDRQRVHTAVPDADTAQAQDIIRRHAPNVSIAPAEKPEKDEPVPMVRNPNTGEMVPDPFAAQRKARATTGIVHEISDKALNKYVAKAGNDFRSRMPDFVAGARNTTMAGSRGEVNAPGSFNTNIPHGRELGNRVRGIARATRKLNMREGTEMKENLIKSLRFLLETEVSQAEVMMAAKSFSQELQEMVEKIGRLQNEDLPPVTDQMRETYGMESASAFQTQIYGALQSVMDSLYTAKGQVDDAVSNMASTGQVDATVDMDKDVGMDGMDDMGGDEMDMGGEDDLDLDNLGDELGAEDDEFGGAAEEEPLGREMKLESAKQLKRKIAEMKKIVEKARRLKEARR